MQAKAGEVGDSGSLVEHVEVAEGELLSNWLSDLKQSLLFLLVTVVVSKLN